MSLRCVNPKGINIYSFDLSNDEWDQLKQENKKLYHLKMPCCNRRTYQRSRQPHNGPDAIENMLCLCPNHHDQFDYYSFYNKLVRSKT